MKKERISERLNEIGLQKELLSMGKNEAYFIDIENELDKTKNRLRLLEKALIYGSNQKEIAETEAMLNKASEELKQAVLYKKEIIKRSAERLRLEITQLESSEITMSERLSTVKERYTLLKGEADKTADAIIATETGEYTASENEKADLRNRLIVIKEEMRAARDEREELIRQIKDVQTSLEHTKLRLKETEEASIVCPLEECRCNELKRVLNAKTARRESLSAEYANTLKYLDELNCMQYSKRLTENRHSRLKRLAEEEDYLKSRLNEKKGGYVNVRSMAGRA